MPFEIGNKVAEGHGRKGYEFESVELERMRKILHKDQSFMEKMQEKLTKGEKLTDDEKEMMKITNGRITKMMDKLHASKQDLTSDGKAIIIQVAKEIAEQNDLPEQK